jgi:hypothetical protein
MVQTPSLSLRLRDGAVRRESFNHVSVKHSSSFCVIVRDPFDDCSPRVVGDLMANLVLSTVMRLETRILFSLC